LRPERHLRRAFVANMRYIAASPEAPAFVREPRYKAFLRKMKLPD
jgi:hypothetical protein